MKFTSISGAAACLAAAACSLAASSASATVLLEYDAASGVTPDAAATPWTRYGTAMTAAGGKLTQHASDGGVSGAPSSEYLSPTLPAGTFTRGGAAYGIEFRVQPLTDTAFVGAAWPRAYLTWSDDQFNYNVTIDKFGDSETSGLGDIVYGQGSFSPANRLPSEAPDIDWSVPHTIFIGHRAAAPGTSVFDFYVDGVLQTTITDGSIARAGSFARDAVDFGDGTTASNAVAADWYFVRVLDVNAPAPIPEPAALTALAAASLTLLRRRR